MRLVLLGVRDEQGVVVNEHYSTPRAAGLNIWCFYQADTLEPLEGGERLVRLAAAPWVLSVRYESAPMNVLFVHIDYANLPDNLTVSWEAVSAEINRLYAG